MRRFEARGKASIRGQAPEVHATRALAQGSQFTTGAAENPTLTIVALAIRQAEYIADQMSKGVV